MWKQNWKLGAESHESDRQRDPWLDLIGKFIDSYPTFTTESGCGASLPMTSLHYPRLQNLISRDTTKQELLLGPQGFAM